MDLPFIRDHVQEYLGDSHLFTGILSKQVGGDRKGRTATSIENAAGSRSCMKEAVDNDPLAWRMLALHTLRKVDMEGLDREAVEWLYDIYPVESDSYEEDSMLEEVMCYISEEGVVEWASIWKSKDTWSRVITTTHWFIALLGAVERGNISEVKWYFSLNDHGVWRREEIESGYSLGYHAALNIHEPGGRGCLEYVTQQGCCRREVGVIEELVRTCDGTIVEWALDQGYT